MNQDNIYKYLTGEATDKEKQELQQWLQESAQNRYFFFEVRAIWHARKQIAISQKEEKLQQALEILNQKINTLPVSSEKKQHRSIFRIASWSISAAVILFIIGLNFMNFRNKSMDKNPVSQDEWISITNTHTDSVKNIILPDGSLIWLAENATLTYPGTFTNTERSVHLDGEAYFEIEKDSVIPFLVKTDVNQIRVLGTSFSVNSHYEGNTNEVILTSGSVQLQRLDGIGLINLHPGQKALYSKETNTIEINEVDLNHFSSWKYGLITLSNSSIESILKCLEETYQTPVLMNTSTLQNRRYHFSFKRSKGLQDALNQLSFMTGVQAEASI